MTIHITDENHTNDLYHVKHELEAYRLVVGVPWSDQKLNMIAIVQEFGTTIYPKNKSVLIIPMKEAQGRRPADIQGLFRPRPPHNHVLAVADKSQPYGMRVMFILKDKVVIPKRPFLRFCINHNADKWAKDAANLTFEAMMGRITPHDVFESLGKTATEDLKRTIKEFSDPHNAPLTVANKGFDDPLIETGKLRDSIMWILERR